MKFLFLGAALLSFVAATAQPRFTDSTFGNNGRIVKNTSVPYKYITDMVLQTDGKTVVLAVAEYNEVYRVVLLRYNTIGTLDNTFSGNGIADSLFVPGVDFSPKAIKLQPDGKILVCGYTSTFPDNGFVIRYLTNGSLDASFGNGGIFYEQPITIDNTTLIPTIDNLVVLPSGQMILLSSDYNTDYDLILTKLNSNGTIDNTYGTNGIIAIDASSSFTPQYSKIEVQIDGKLLIGGNLNEYDQSSGLYLNLVVMRLNVNGSIDNSYGTNGRVALHTGPADYDIFKDMALQPDGKIVVSGVGNTYFNIYNYAFLVRITTNGTPDASFGTGGSSIILPGTNGAFYSTEGQMTLQQDGKILLTGCSSTTIASYNMAIARITTAGLPDASFDGDGFATLSVNAYTNYAIAAQQQADGKLVLSGLARNVNAASTTIARLTPTGQVDATLDAVAAIAFIGSGTNEEAGASIQIQPDGKILNITGRYNGEGYDLSISRYSTTGVLDATYGNSGNNLIEFPPDYRSFFAGLLSNGKLMLATGYSDYFIGAGVLMTRMNINGITDSSFGTNGKLFIKTRNEGFANAAPQAAFQPDGKIVLLYAQLLSNNYADDSTFVVRLNSNGSFDNTFNGGNKKYLPQTSLNTDFTKLCLQPDAKILVAETEIYPAANTAVQRFNTNGNIDNTFNNGTPANIAFQAGSMIVQTDGKILLGSYYASAARLNTNGTPDAGFGTAGVADFSATLSNFYGHTCIKEADSNRLVFVGSAYDTVTFDTYVKLVALKRNGSLDTSFGNAGSIDELDIPQPGDNNSPIAVQADGKILLTSYIESGSTYYADAILMRLKPNASTTGRLYTFTGSGLWSNPANWSNGTVPPTTIPSGSSVVIDPPIGSECIIDITVHVQAGATVTVRAGKTVRLPGNLIIQ